MDVSIIIPVYNGEKWLDECLSSVEQQSFSGRLEISIFNDGSTDNTAKLISSWQDRFAKTGINIVVTSGESPKGVGYAKNKAVEQSTGIYLCFLDADDVMKPNRVQKQWDIAISFPGNTIIGCQFERCPPNSTARYTEWANKITSAQLYTQVYTSHGPTIVMPTWFCHRSVFDKVGGFSELGKGTPEDLIFFYAHLDNGGQLFRVDECLMVYRFHADAVTFSIHESTIWDVRLRRLEKLVLKSWSAFTIWNAGKQGRHLYRSLHPENRRKVVAFCDVDAKKIGKKFYTFEESEMVPKPKVPIIHFTEAKRPFILCVKLDLTGGGFEDNLASMNLQEGIDYYHFS